MKSLFLSMKKIILLVIVLFSYNAINAADKDESPLTVMSYNIRMGSANDGTNSWQYRYPATFEMMMDIKPDVIGMQELLPLQKFMIDEYVEEYKSVGVGRDDGKKKGEIMAIYWNPKTIKLKKWGVFWLSETPEKPSKGWDAACKRTATWAIMKDKRTGKSFFFVDTHLDHKGKQARQEGLKLIMQKIKELNKDNLPFILVGDFNIYPDNPALISLNEQMDSAREKAEKTDNLHSFNHWGRDKKIIDYIYYTGVSKCVSFETIIKKYADKPFISDHYPIMAQFIL